MLFFDNTLLSTLSCDFRVHRAGSQLKRIEFTKTHPPPVGSVIEIGPQWTHLSGPLLVQSSSNFKFYFQITDLFSNVMLLVLTNEILSSLHQREMSQKDDHSLGEDGAARRKCRPVEGQLFILATGGEDLVKPA